MRLAIAFVTIASVMAAVGAHAMEDHPYSSSYASPSSTTPAPSTPKTVISASTFSSAISTSTKTIDSQVTSTKKVIETITDAIIYTIQAPTTQAPTTSAGYTRNLTTTQSTKELVTVTSALGFNGSNHTSTPSFSPVPTSAGGVASPFGAAVFAVVVAGIMCLGF